MLSLKDLQWCGVFADGPICCCFLYLQVDFFSYYFISIPFEWIRTTWRNQWSTNKKQHRKIVKILMSLHTSYHPQGAAYRDEEISTNIF